MNIKETKDVFHLVIEAAEAIKAAKADGKADWKDLLSPETRDLIPAAIAAAQGADKIQAELADADQAEIKELVELGIQAGAAMVDALLT